jgi:hypothetical protein
MVPDRGGEAQRAGDLVGALLGGSLGRGLGPAQKAARAWYAANGDRERAHTTRVWLRKSGRTGQDPVLVVELDAGWLAGELSTNKELYLSRLAFRGIRVSDICFKVGRRQDVAALRARPTPGEPPELARLSEEERSRVARATNNLPDGLKQSVSRAMCASLARNKTRTS